MTDEYPIDAARFIAALRQERGARVSGGIYHGTQVSMAYNSNRIEGSRLTEDQTRMLYDTKTVSGDPVPVDDVIETRNSFRLFDEMIDHAGEPITAELMKHYHRVLKNGTAQADVPWFAVGNFKTRANEVGGRSTTHPTRVAAEIAGLTAPRGPMTFHDIVDFHYRFEAIHPFQDGNGRVGRILMFQQCLAHGIMPFVVLDEHKAFYYRGLSVYEDEPGFLRDTLRSFQDRYYERFSDLIVDHNTTRIRAAFPELDPRRSPRGADDLEQRDQGGLER